MVGSNHLKLSFADGLNTLKHLKGATAMRKIFGYLDLKAEEGDFGLTNTKSISLDASYNLPEGWTVDHSLYSSYTLEVFHGIPSIFPGIP